MGTEQVKKLYAAPKVVELGTHGQFVQALFLSIMSDNVPGSPGQVRTTSP